MLILVLLCTCNIMLVATLLLGFFMDKLVAKLPKEQRDNWDLGWQFGAAFWLFIPCAEVFFYLFSGLHITPMMQFWLYVWYVLNVLHVAYFVALWRVSRKAMAG